MSKFCEPLATIGVAAALLLAEAPADHIATMKKLQIIRHAHASAAGTRDEDRPLSSRGLRWAEELGTLLCAADAAPQAWLVSPARRTVETAEAIAKSRNEDINLQLIKALYLAEPQEIVEAITEFAASSDSACVIAHNPGLEILAGVFLQRTRVQFPPGSALLVSIDTEDWQQVLTASSRVTRFIPGEQG